VERFRRRGNERSEAIGAGAPGQNPLQRAMKKRDCVKAQSFLFLVTKPRRDSNKEGAYEVCGRKGSGGAFSPTWQRA